MKKLSFTNIFPFIFFIAVFSCNSKVENQDARNWKVYKGDDGVNAYSSLADINTDNVGNLKLAWTYRSGDNIGNSSIQCNPLIIDGILYGVSPKMKAFALDAKTGKELWRYDPFDKNSQQGGVSRGVAYWKEGNEARIFLCAAYKIIALDAATGKQLMDFGDSGFVDMRKGLRNDADIEEYYIVNTSPAVVYKNLVIVGSSMGETYLGLPGNIRAFDVRTGKPVWKFNTIPEPGERGYETWPPDAYKTAGGCNAWSGLSIDRQRGMLFAATGSPSFDFHGGDRKGNNLFGNSVIALDASTGKYIWHYQVSHHDLWDYDLPAPPILTKIKKDGKSIDAVAQLTKQGFIFLFDREKGTLLNDVEEKKVPATRMADDVSSETQPFPKWPEPLSRLGFDTSLITDISPGAHGFVKKSIAGFHYADIYTPPDTVGIIQLPGFRGGAEWSGGAVDPEGVLYVGVNDIANVVQLVELDNEQMNLNGMNSVKAGGIVYQKNCSPCHGPDRKGNGPYPSLLGLENRLNVQQAGEILNMGRNKMPSFAHLPASEKKAVLSFLFNLKNQEMIGSSPAKTKEVTGSTVKKYKIKAYLQLKDEDGFPGIKPPWGLLKAVDLNTGKLLWKRTLGDYPELARRGITGTGTQLFGGGIVTAGGLIFIGASKDEKFRAIDKKTGKTVWEYQLPAGGYATPSTYMVDGKQYVVIAAGGGGFQVTPSADYYMAFALPD